MARKKHIDHLDEYYLTPSKPTGPSKRKGKNMGNGEGWTPSPKMIQFGLKNKEQEIAWSLFKEVDVLFLLGPAGTGKSHIAVMFAIYDMIQHGRQKLVLTRPIVEAGENLGFLPGDLSEKVHPYMLPLYDCLDKVCGVTGDVRDWMNERYELAPLAFMRGRTFENAVCVLDEAQNCCEKQLKMFLTRLGGQPGEAKMIITGDPEQTDSGRRNYALIDTVDKVRHLPGVGVIEFTEQAVCRHPLVREFGKLL